MCRITEHDGPGVHPWRMPAATPLPALLYLVRHGDVCGDPAGPQLSGRTDLALSRRGLSQAECLRASRLATLTLAAIYSSPLRRARETAEALRRLHGLPLRLCPDLQEIDCGHLDGHPLARVQSDHAELWAANLRQTDDRFRWPGGESYRELRCRCLRAIRRIARAHRGERVAVVTHAGVVGQIVGYLRGTGAARWELHRPGHTGITEVAWGCGAGQVLGFDDRSHLSPAG